MIHFFSLIQRYLRGLMTLLHAQKQPNIFITLIRNLIQLIVFLNQEAGLGVMTCFLTTDEAFESWYYRRDPTHVTFYCEKTFEVIASQRNWQYEFPSKDIVLLQKPNE